MSETKWSPGEWAIDIGEAGDVYRYVITRDDVVARIKLREPFGLVHIHAEHNARLIAAAPKLYEALNDCLALMNALHTNEHHQTAVKEAARAALAKARGEA